MRYLLAFLVAAGTVSCIPTIENVTSSFPVDPALERLNLDQGQVLVLPMWNDDESCNLRSPFLLAASEIMTIDDHLEPRRRLGILDAAGHGPSHFRYLAGLLLFRPGARMLWVAPERYPNGDGDVYWRPRYQAEYGSQLITEVRAWLESRASHPPAVLELNTWMASCKKYRVHISTQEAKEAVGYFDSDPLAKQPRPFSGWKPFSTESNSRINPTVCPVTSLARNASALRASPRVMRRVRWPI